MKDAIYFPILRAKRGEMNAIARLQSSSKVAVRPMFDIPDYKEHKEDVALVHSGAANFSLAAGNASSFLKLTPFDPEEESGRSAPIAPAAVLSGVTITLANTWGTSYPLYLDLSRHDPDEKIGESAAVTHLFNCSRQAGLLAIPVAAPKLNRSASYLKAVAAIARRDQRGIGLRLDYDQFAEIDSLQALIDETLRELEINEDVVDLFLDSGPVDKLPLSDPLQKSLRNVYSLALLALERRRFRNVVLAASSIPKTFRSSQEGAPCRVPNNEFAIWENLVGTPSNRALKLSDYGARYAHQKDGGGSVIPPARIHLVTAHEHLLYVGESQQYRELCGFAMQFLEHAQNTFGVPEIRECARNNGEPKRATEWVERDTAMHLEVILSAARGRLGELGVLGAFDFEAPERSYPQQQALLTSS